MEPTRHPLGDGFFKRLFGAAVVRGNIGLGDGLPQPRRSAFGPIPVFHDSFVKLFDPVAQFRWSSVV